MKVGTDNQSSGRKKCRLHKLIVTLSLVIEIKLLKLNTILLVENCILPIKKDQTVEISKFLETLLRKRKIEIWIVLLQKDEYFYHNSNKYSNLATQEESHKDKTVCYYYKND